MSWGDWKWIQWHHMQANVLPVAITCKPVYFQKFMAEFVLVIIWFFCQIKSWFLLHYYYFSLIFWRRCEDEFDHNRRWSEITTGSVFRDHSWCCPQLCSRQEPKKNLNTYTISLVHTLRVTINFASCFYSWLITLKSIIIYEK